MTETGNSELVTLEYSANRVVGTLGINNPKVNALSGAVRSVFLAKMQEAIDAHVKALIIRGLGKGFSAGADLTELLEVLKVGENAAREWLWEGHRFINAVASAPVYKVALIYGFAMGGGLELAMACNERYVIGPAKLALPEVKIGLYPGWQGTIRSARLMKNKAVAREFYESGVELLPHLAMKLGLVDEAVSQTDPVEFFIGINTHENWAPSREESRTEIETFLARVRPPEGQGASPAVAAIEKFLSRK